MEKLTAKASIQIQKPIHEVFEAIVDPNKMSHYFIKGSTGRLETGKTIDWTFPEFAESFPVTGKTIEADSYISFDWSGGTAGQLVEIHLSTYGDSATVVKITEHEMNNDKDGILIMMRQTEGWANFLACLKAYLEYGINLRTAAFDFMFQQP
ncbi:SRPBCC domain-containing protein [Sphingobacterium thalpophilum]|uniref:Activator of Hsp90 ATPase homolog 1-like protein n=1 Tax=Sphingobacterium thalpophilum TaxID=259 RepID=A0A4V6KNB0_9SPHI|nr:SRPBCC domain-containing protein [Sphingobacterium thalpophilum]VTR30208.1 Activator of Hsp90 ATPase homolog 1-like protein [Sphingobacterium thalpophilum]